MAVRCRTIRYFIADYSFVKFKFKPFGAFFHISAGGANPVGYAMSDMRSFFAAIGTDLPMLRLAAFKFIIMSIRVDTDFQLFKRSFVLFAIEIFFAALTIVVRLHALRGAGRRLFGDKFAVNMYVFVRISALLFAALFIGLFAVGTARTLSAGSFLLAAALIFGGITACHAKHKAKRAGQRNKRK